MGTMSDSDKPNRRVAPLLKIADWPWWLNRDCLPWIFLALFYARDLYFELLWDRYRRIFWITGAYGTIAAIWFGVRLWEERRTEAKKKSQKDAKENPKSCPKCRYELGTTLLHCPICGTET